MSHRLLRSHTTVGAPAARRLHPAAATVPVAGIITLDSVSIPSVGASATVEHTVEVADTALALGSGDVPVLGTPRVLALLEQATVDAVAHSLPAESTTVGARVEIEHLLPSAVGDRVVASATLADVQGRRLTFEVRLTERGRLLASGSIVRVVAERRRFGA